MIILYQTRLQSNAEMMPPIAYKLILNLVQPFLVYQYLILLLHTLIIASTAAGSVAALAEDRKINKYSHLSPSYLFTPISIETIGAVGPKSLRFLKDLGTKIMRQSGDPHSYSYLMQRLSVTIQKSNMVAVLGSIEGGASDFLP